MTAASIVVKRRRLLLLLLLPLAEHRPMLLEDCAQLFF
jgi:hypothetical protein